MTNSRLVQDRNTIPITISDLTFDIFSALSVLSFIYMHKQIFSVKYIQVTGESIRVPGMER